MSQSTAKSWRAGSAKALERQFAAMAAAVPVGMGQRRGRAARRADQADVIDR
jgi:hypothetical protein